MISLILGLSVLSGILLISLSGYVNRLLGVCLSLLIYIISLVIWFILGSDINYSEFIFGVCYVLDGLSIKFVLLTTFLGCLCVLSVWDHKDVLRFMGLIILLEGLVLGVFMVSNVLWFYIFFESVLIPMYVMMGLYGSRGRKVRAGYYLFIYTLMGSLFMLIGVILIYLETGSFDYWYIESYSLINESLVWFLFFMGFLVKIPLFPAHIWLAEAHVEAPTEGSVLLAGVLLKLGTYGFLRYNIDLMGMSSVYYLPLVSVLGCIGMVYTSLTCLRQTDIKRVIAYGSVGHMSMTIVGLVSLLEEGIKGGVVQMIGHGLVSGGLFFCIGFLYSRVGSREIFYMSGISSMMPTYSIVFLILILGNMGLPGTVSFVGEFLLFESIFVLNNFVGFLTGLGMFLTGGYSLYLYNRVMFGNVSNRANLIVDINIREISIILPVVLLVLLLGVWPSLLIA